MFCSYGSDFTIVWSEYVEREADRRVRARQASVRSVREKARSELTPSGERASRFQQTDSKDRQVLADAVAAGAMLIVTEDVDDFAEAELFACGIAAVNPDVFLAECVSTDAYAEAVRRMSAKMSTPAHTAEQLHAKLGRQHPRAVAEHRAAFDAEPDPAVNESPKALYRGDRCLRCSRTGNMLEIGVCENCRNNSSQ
jgi:hypothetical protein